MKITFGDRDFQWESCPKMFEAWNLDDENFEAVITGKDFEQSNLKFSFSESVHNNGWWANLPNTEYWCKVDIY